jgi:NOL1/NOP2/fmu family ribosome biogenesis protein
MKRMLFLAAMTTLVLTACNRTNNEEEEVLAETAEDQALAEGIWDDVAEQSESSSESIETEDDEWTPCAVITVDTLGSPFPLRVTVDFGTTGCEGRDGKVRKGKLGYTLTGWMRLEGSSLTVSPEAYYVDDYKVEGTRTTVNLGENAENQLQFSVKVENAVVTDPDGQAVSWESERVRTWIEGRETGFFTPNGNGGFMGWDGVTDDVYEITGSSAGTNRADINYTVIITEALRVQLNCRHITSGVITIEPEGYGARILDYGDGACDNQATLTTRRGSQNITLRR